MATKNLKKAAKSEDKDLKEGFDEAKAEKEKPTVDIEILGETFTIPRRPPAWAQLFVARYGEGKDKDVPFDKYIEFVVKLLGDDIMDHIFEIGDNYFDAEDLNREVISKIRGVWQGETDDKKK